MPYDATPFPTHKTRYPYARTIRTYPYHTIVEELPLTYRTHSGGTTLTIPYPIGGRYPYWSCIHYCTHTCTGVAYTTTLLPIRERDRAFTRHATLGWWTAPILRGTTPFPSPTAYYPYAYAGNTHPCRTIPEELPVPYPFRRIYPYYTLPTLEERSHTSYIPIPMLGLRTLPLLGIPERRIHPIRVHIYLTVPTQPHNLHTRLSGNRIRRRRGRTTCQHYGSLGDREGEGQEKGRPRSV